MGSAIRQRRCTLHGAPALVPVTGTVAFADTKAPALTATAPCPGSAPPSQSGRQDLGNNDNLSPYPQPCRGCCALGWGSCVNHPAPVSQVLTLRYSTGLVTLNLSIVVMMIAGVVRKKRRMKRTTLITKQRIHHIKPRMERCSLGGRKRASGWLHRVEYQVWGFACRPQPSLVNKTWGASPRLSPSQSDQIRSDL